MNSQLRKRIEVCTNEVDLVRIFRSMKMRSLRNKGKCAYTASKMNGPNIYIFLGKKKMFNIEMQERETK